jgi:hypothetical protein
MDESGIDARWQPPAWSGPSPTMVQALDLVQADLDASGLGDHVMKYEVAEARRRIPSSTSAGEALGRQTV